MSGDRVASTSTDRVPFSGGAAGGSTPPPSGGAAPTLPDADNQTGSALPVGTLIATDPAGAKRVQPFDATVAAAAAARYLGVVTESGGIANGATGEVTITGAIPVLFKAGLTLVDGQEVYASTTPGSATNLTDLNGAGAPPSNGVIQHLGVIVDSSGYDGVTNLTAECVVYYGGRRQVP